MRFFRVAKAAHTALDGAGARDLGGRWNSPGRPVVYAATHLSLAVLEQLVRIPTGRVPHDYIYLVIDLVDRLAVEELSPEALPRWSDPDLTASRGFGDAWLRDRRTPVLLVPSLVVPIERNALLNPLHPALRRLAPMQVERLVFDRRLFERPGR